METSYTKINKTKPNEEEEVDINEVPSNLSILPLENDFAVCELCGFVGIRTYFYARDNKYCSLRCYISKTRRRYFNCKFKVMGSTEHMADMIPLEPLPQLQHWTGPPTDLQTGPLKPSQHIVPNSYEWSDELFGFDFLAAPVSLFKHAPLHDMWDNTFEGMKVEVKNTDGDGSNNKPTEYFWVATVIKVKGYMGLLRYEGFGSDDSKDFWVNLCCSEIHPVGWCATRGKPLIPPKSIEDKYSDWKRFLVKQLTGARTLPVNFYTKLAEQMKSRFSVGNFIEVVNKNRISQLKLATIHEIIGKRLHIKYYNAPADDIGFWCHEDSPLIHPVGWAYTVGHPIDAPETYCLRVATGRSLPDDSTPDMFFKFPTNEPPLFSPGMMLEAIDPLNLSSLCTATVTRILNDGYMMIRIDCYPEDPTGSDWFCYHQRSPCIFPVGFAMANNIPLIPPNGWSAESFTWEACLASRGAQAAPARLFAPRPRVLGFAAGMRLECADLMDPRLICVATVNRVVANMLKITFDGWNSEFDQWLWAHSTDMYPVGWARAVGLRLEGPHAVPAPRPPPRPKPKPPRVPRVPRRRRRAQLSTTTNDDSQTSEQSGFITSSSHTSTSPSSTHISPPSTHTSPPSTHTSPTFSTCSPATTFSVSVSSPATAFSASVSSPSSPISTCLANVASPSIITNVSPGNSGSVTSPMQCSSQREEVNGIHNHQNDMDDSSAVPESSSTEPLSTETDESTDMDGQKLIPRLIDNGTLWAKVNVDDWGPEDVAKFLTRNDCQPYCENFCNITGSHLLQLSKDEIIELLEMKVGPSLKIYDLIQQLKFKVKPPCKLNNGK